MLQVSELFIYPIKSLGGIAVSSAEITDRGFKYDRRWLLVDERNYFITQREFAAMALLRVEIETGGLRITHKTSGENILIPFEPQTNDYCEVVVFDDKCTAVYVGNTVDEWFSKILGIKCRLVYMPDDSQRRVSEQHVPDGYHITSFSDAYAFLIVGQASLDDLNRRLDEPLPINRFRPNIVFTGGKPFQEDLMDNFTIGDIDFYGVKLSARCVVTTINQNNSTKTKEPLKTLATFRRRNNDVYFGQNLIHKGTGIISVGDIIEVASYHTHKKFII